MSTKSLIFFDVSCNFVNFLTNSSDLLLKELNLNSTSPKILSIFDAFVIALVKGFNDDCPFLKLPSNSLYLA